MNDDAFARRFYADRAELESLGIELKVDKPAEGYYEAENYSLPPENFYLPAIEFTDAELGALRTALSLLDGEFAYAEPLRLALQQLSWGRPSPLDAPEQPLGGARRDRGRRRPRAVAAAVEGRDRDLPPQDDRVRLLHDRPRRAARRARSTPTTCSTAAASSTSSATRTSARTCACSALSRIRGKVGYSSKAEHDFAPPEDFDPREYATRTDWQLGDADRARRAIWISSRIDWLVRAPLRPRRRTVHGGRGDGVIFETDYADSRADGVLGARARRARPHPRAAGAGGRGRRAPRR